MYLNLPFSYCMLQGSVITVLASPSDACLLGNVSVASDVLNPGQSKSFPVYVVNRYASTFGIILTSTHGHGHGHGHGHEIFNLTVLSTLKRLLNLCQQQQLIKLQHRRVYN